MKFMYDNRQAELRDILEAMKLEAEGAGSSNIGLGKEPMGRGTGVNFGPAE